MGAHYADVRQTPLQPDGIVDDVEQTYYDEDGRPLEKHMGAKGWM
jgi:hypothetical protein